MMYGRCLPLFQLDWLQVVQYTCVMGSLQQCIPWPVVRTFEFLTVWCVKVQYALRCQLAKLAPTLSASLKGWKLPEH